MSALPVSSLFKIILESRSSKRFLLATIISFAFSMTVILGTIGLMDGFQYTLKSALSKSNSDIKFSAINKLFLDDEQLSERFLESGVKSYSSILQVESFALIKGVSKGILLRGVNDSKFSNLTGLNLNNLKDGVFIGSKFKDKFGIAVGDEIVLALANKKDQTTSRVKLVRLKVNGYVTHGIHEKDMRYVYISKSLLESKIGYKKGSANYGLIKVSKNQNIQTLSSLLNEAFEDQILFRPYWSEFKTLLEAVEMEKFSISLILQIIVIVAILNIMGFVIFISETKAQEFFMLRALGLSFKSYQNFWFILLFFIWLVSCFVGQCFLFILENGILKLPIFQIPSDIYVLSELVLKLEFLDYLYVFGLSLVWIMLVGIITLRRQKNKSLLSGLRQEFV